MKGQKALLDVVEPMDNRKKRQKREKILQDGIDEMERNQVDKRVAEKEEQQRNKRDDKRKEVNKK
jgi:hypothetical protein